MEQKELGNPAYGGEPLVVNDKRRTTEAALAAAAAEKEAFVAANGADPALGMSEEATTLTEDELAALLSQHAQQDDSSAIPRPSVLTAFLVLIDHEGNVQAQGDVNAINGIDVTRPATFSDMYSAACHIQKDIAGQEATHRVMVGLAQQAQAAQQAAQANQIMGRRPRIG